MEDPVVKEERRSIDEDDIVGQPGIFIPASTSSTPWELIHAQSTHAKDEDSISTSSSDLELFPCKSGRVIGLSKAQVKDNLNFLEAFGGKESMKVKLSLALKKTNVVFLIGPLCLVLKE